MPKQSDYIRKLYREYLDSAGKVVATQYADAEKRGEVKRDKDAYNLDAETYAKALWRNGWRSDSGKKPYLSKVASQDGFLGRFFSCSRLTWASLFSRSSFETESTVRRALLI